MKKWLLSLVSGCLLSHSVHAAQGITRTNWANHPDIVEVRLLYNSTQLAEQAGKLEKHERYFEACEPGENDVRRIWTDMHGRPQIYYDGSGSEHSYVQREFYFDASGALRFAYFVAGADNGTVVEYRIYFSKAGKKIWEIRKHLKGPGYFFPTEWPETELIRNPEQAFRATSLCIETN